MKNAAAVVAMFLLTGCAPALAKPSAVQNPGQPSRCATLLVKALTSPNAVVHGAFACQDDALRAQATAGGITSDADLQGVAQSPPVYLHPHLAGQLPDGGWEWLASVDTGSALNTVHILVWTDSDGRVSQVALT